MNPFVLGKNTARGRHAARPSRPVTSDTTTPDVDNVNDDATEVHELPDWWERRGARILEAIR